jgi:hypothetical protein
MVHHWVLTTKFQDALLSLMKENGNAKSLDPNAPSHWKLQDLECIVLVVSSYKSLSMAKWDFNLVLGLQNRWITSFRYIMIHVDCRWGLHALSLSRRGKWLHVVGCFHHHDIIKPKGSKWGGKKIDSFVGFVSSFFRSQNKIKFIQQQKHWR